MLIDGEKWACEACVRGHRVSNCQHSDRPLTHINKKGRPVSQCPHCRGLRRARASHVKCECGEKPHAKDDHDLEQAFANGDAAILNSPPSEATNCCCSHGERCTCALKKDHLDPVFENGFDRPPKHSRKPTLSSAHSDPITVFKNHHHKPVHKHNHAAHDNAPYKIPIPHSISGNSDVAHKSVDSLPLPRKAESQHSQLQESISSAQQESRKVRSEHGSPEPGVFRYGDIGDLPPLDLPYPAYSSSYGNSLECTSPPLEPFSYPNTSSFDNYYNAPDYTTPDDEPLLSAGCAMPPVDWSQLNLAREYDGLPKSYRSPPSYSSFDHSNFGQPGLTTSSSDEISETGDYVTAILKQAQANNATPPETKSNPYRLSSASSFMSMPHASQLANADENLDIDAILENAKNAAASPISFDGLSEAVDPEKFTKHGITVQDAQKLAHPSTKLPPTQAMGELSLPTPSDENDPLWGSTFNSTEDVTSNAEKNPANFWGR